MANGLSHRIKQYRVIMHGDDGNLVLYRVEQALWANGGQGAGARAVMQADGNLVIYDDQPDPWNSRTSPFLGAELALQDDGNLVINHGGRAIWTKSAGYVGDRLGANGQLPPAGIVRSRDGHFRLAS